jgi:hypothetical protein
MESFEVPFDPNQNGLVVRRDWNYFDPNAWPFPWPPPTPTPGNTNAGAGDRGGAVNAALPGTVIPVIYGRQRVKGQLLFADAWSTSAQADFWYSIGEGPINSVEDSWANDARLTTNPYITVTLHNGDKAQSQDSTFNTRSTNISRLPRTAYARVSAVDPRSLNPDWHNVFPGGESYISEVYFEVKGLKVYDPRLDSTVTGGSGSQRANDPTTWAWSDNPVLCIRDFLCDPVHGCGLGHSSGYVNDVNIIAAANACDTLGFTLNIALTSEGDATSWLDQMRLVCNATVYVDNGQYCIFIDQTQSSVVVDFTTLGSGANCRQVNYIPVSQRDQPTRVIVEYPHASHKYAQDTVTCDNPGIALGTVQVREARYKADGIVTEAQAWKIGTYIVNKATYPLRVDFLASFVSHKLTVGSLITLTTDEGLAAQKFVVDAIEEQDGVGEVKVTARIYFDDIFSSTIVTGDTAPSTSIPDANGTPPDITLVGVSPTSTTPSSLPNTTARKIVVTTNTATQSTKTEYVAVDYTPPTTFPWAHELVIRWDSSIGFATATWASMSANELVIPLSGNTDPWNEGGATFWLPGLIGEITTNLFAANGEVIGGTLSGGQFRIIARVRSIAGNLSSGVTIDCLGYMSSTAAADGGAEVKTRPLILVEDTLPAVSAAGEANIVMDSATHTVKISVNGGAYAALGGGGGGGTPTRIYGGSGITGSINDSNTTFTTSVNASVATFFLVIVDGVIDFAATWSGTTLTPSSAPHAGIDVLYWS